MRIALLNLPLDNNYGGNLQRYALIKVIQGLGHDINHIFLTRYRHLKWYKKPFTYGKRFFIRYILKHKDVIIFSESKFNKEPNKVSESVLNFYMRYIPHTQEVNSFNKVKAICNQAYDCFLVGSDQVWRKRMTMQIGLYSYFLSFLGKRKVRRVAYGVSMGTEENELSDKEIKRLSNLYKRFYAVSVRELFMLDYFEKYGWKNPHAEIVIDPTMLLNISDYRLLFDSKNVPNDKQTENKIYCYILDESSSTDSFIKEMSAKMRKDFQKTTLNSYSVGIEQWLNNIYYADLVITDSYHGTVFSILFNKKFIFIGNNMRGNARISSLFSLLEIDSHDTMNLNWNNINLKIEKYRQSSIDFLKKSLS